MSGDKVEYWGKWKERGMNIILILLIYSVRVGEFIFLE